MRSERTSTMRAAGEQGMALVAALLIMLLMSALLVSFTTVIMNEQRFRGIDKDRVRAYYGAQSGLEKLTVDMGNLFLTNIAPTAAQIAALSTAANQPAVPGISFSAPAGITAYGAALVACDNAGNTTCNATVQTGPYQGLIALKKSYQLDAVAVTSVGGEAHLSRKIELVSIPVFQFGTFSTVDLSFYAGNAFTFAGRVHSNGNLFLTAQDTYTTTLTDKVTAVGDIIRQTMSNGLAVATSGFNGTVSMAKATNSFRNLLVTDGSLTGGVGSAANTNWSNISLSTYNGYIRNGGCPPATGCAVPARGTGAKALNLALVTVGGTNTDLTRRPPSNELATNPVLFGERLFGKASVRILLSDTAAEITSLPTVTAIAPVHLGDEGNPLAGYTNDWAATPPPASNGVAFLGVGTAIPGGGFMPPIARSPGLQLANMTANTANNQLTQNINVAAPFAAPYNSPASLTFNMFINQANATAGLPIYQTITCTIVTSTQFQTCLRSPNTGLLNTAAGYVIKILDGSSINQTFALTSAVSAGGVGVTKNYTVASTASAVANTFWLQNSIDQTWNTVTCLGVNTFNVATALYTTGGPVLQWQNCSNVPPATKSVASLGAGPGITTNALVGQNVGATGGYLKIEIQKADFTWKDVTMEVLNWGFADRNQDGADCGDPTPNAIIRLQRLRDNGGTCHYYPASAQTPTTNNTWDYWPNTIFDTREALFRSVAPANKDVMLGGVIHYVALDVGNLSKWLNGTAPYGAGSGNQSLSVNGYTVYFSDRRNNRSDGTNATCLDPNLPAPCATGEYGFEDVVNSTNAAGTPNAALDAGEDVNGNALLDTYGQFPNFMGVINALPPGAVAPFNAAANIRPTTAVGRSAAMTTRAYLFRRALKLQNAGQGSIVMPGLTVATENPVYIQGDWNWNGGALTAAHAETSVIGDAVTLLSSAWTDANAFINPYNASNRVRAASNWYRIAIVGGKSMAFAWPTVGGPDNTFGTDGGVHNFLRYLETGAGTVNYVGSTATFYYSRQGVGTYKFNLTPPAVVYSAPTRAYAFDTDFLNPATLPPLTPVFRDVNILGFSQEMRPGK